VAGWSYVLWCAFGSSRMVKTRKPGTITGDLNRRSEASWNYRTCGKPARLRLRIYWRVSPCQKVNEAGEEHDHKYNDT
jgi:hypothetical protein